MILKLRLIVCSIVLSLLAVTLAFGQVKPHLTARVDTTQQDVKLVYKLIGDYFNSSPDSLYNNPYWNKNEVDYFYTQKRDNFDQAAFYLFYNMNSKQLFTYFKPNILSIAPVGDKYISRILLSADTLQLWMKEHKMNPPFILRYYAAKDEAGNWKLENTWSNELTEEVEPA